MATDLLDIKRAMQGERSPHVPVVDMDPETSKIFESFVAPRLGELPPEGYKEPPGFLGQLAGGVLATVPTAVEIAAGMGGMATGGLAGLAGEVVDQGSQLLGYGRPPEPGRGQAWMDAVGGATTNAIRQAAYLGMAPETMEDLSPETQGAVGKVNWVMEKLHESAQWWNDKVYEWTNDPMLAMTAGLAVEQGAMMFGPKMLKEGAALTRSKAAKLRRAFTKSAETGKPAPELVDKLKELLDDMRNSRYGPDIEAYDKILKQAGQKAAPVGELPAPRSVIEVGETGPIEPGTTGKGYKWSPEGGYTPTPPIGTLRAGEPWVKGTKVIDSRTQPTVETQPLAKALITRSEKVKLNKLGYSKEDIAALKPEDASRIIEDGVTKTPIEKTITTGEKTALQYFTDTIQLPGIVTQPIKDLKSVLPKMKTGELGDLIDAVDSYVENNPGSMKGVLKKKYDAMKKEIEGRTTIAESVAEPTPPVVTENPVLSKILEEEPKSGRRSVLRKKEEAPEAGAPELITERTEVSGEPKSEPKKTVPKTTPESQAKKYGLDYKDSTEITYDDGKVEVIHTFYDPVSGKYFNSDSLPTIKHDLAALRKGEGTLTSDAIAAERGGLAPGEEVAAAPPTSPYSGQSIPELIQTAQRWLNGDTTVNIGDVKKEITKLLNEESASKYETNQEYLDFQERGDRLLGKLTQEMRKKGEIPLEEEAVTEQTIEQAKQNSTQIRLRKQKTEFDEAYEKVTSGDPHEPKTLTKAERLKLLKQRNQIAQEKVLRGEKTTRSIEEGESLIDQIPDEYRKAYEAALEQQREAVEGSEPRGLGEVASDIYTLIGDERGSISVLPGKAMSPEMRLAIQRLYADAKRLGKDFYKVMLANGFTEFEVAIFRRALSQMRDVTPENSKEPKNTQVLYDIEGDPIVKQRKVKGLQKIPLRQSEVEMIQNLPELPQRQFSFLGSPIRTFERLGQDIKEQFYYDYRKRETRIKQLSDEVRKDIDELRKGVNRQELGRTGAYSYAQQPKGEALLRKAGVDIPSGLTSNESALYKSLRSRYDTLLKEINSVRTSIGRDPIEKIDNYSMFSRTFNILEQLGIVTNPVLEQAPLISAKYLRHSEVPFKYSILRKKTGTYPIELDPLRVYEKYALSAIRHMEMSPLIAKITELIETKLPDPSTGKLTWRLEHHAPRTHATLRAWNNFISGTPSFTLPRVIERPLSMLTNNLTVSILGASVRSALIQPTSLINTVTETGLVNTLRGLEDLFTNTYKKEMAMSQVLPTRAFDISVTDAARSLGRGNILEAYRTVGRWTLKGLSILDMQAARATWNAGFEMATKDLHMSGERAVNFADDVVVRTQASALPGDLAPIQRSAAGKAASLFQTFTINNWEFLTKDVLRLGEKVPITDVARMKKVISFIAATTFFNILYEDIAGIKSPALTPINAALESRKQGDSALETAWKVGMEFVEPIPLIGGTKYGKGPGGPVVELTTELFRKATDQPLQKPWPELVGKVVGVPGTTQVGKYRRARKRGEGLWGSLVGTYREPVKRRGLGGLKGPRELPGP